MHSVDTFSALLQKNSVVPPSIGRAVRVYAVERSSAWIRLMWPAGAAPVTIMATVGQAMHCCIYMGAALCCYAHCIQIR